MPSEFFSLLSRQAALRQTAEVHSLQVYPLLPFSCLSWIEFTFSYLYHFLSLLGSGLLCQKAVERPGSGSNNRIQTHHVLGLDASTCSILHPPSQQTSAGAAPHENKALEAETVAVFAAPGLMCCLHLSPSTALLTFPPNVHPRSLVHTSHPHVPAWYLKSAFSKGTLTVPRSWTTARCQVTDG